MIRNLVDSYIEMDDALLEIVIITNNYLWRNIAKCTVTHSCDGGGEGPPGKTRFSRGDAKEICKTVHFPSFRLHSFVLCVTPKALLELCRRRMWSTRCKTFLCGTFDSFLPCRCWRATTMRKNVKRAWSSSVGRRRPTRIAFEYTLSIVDVPLDKAEYAAQDRMNRRRWRWRNSQREKNAVNRSIAQKCLFGLDYNVVCHHVAFFGMVGNAFKCDVK